MKEFTGSFGFVVAFLVGTLIFNMLFGEKVATVYLVLVLMGMVYTNVDTFSEIMGRFSQP
jgi:positive regulator of sigma E activity